MSYKMAKVKTSAWRPDILLHYGHEYAARDSTFSGGRIYVRGGTKIAVGDVVSISGSNYRVLETGRTKHHDVRLIVEKLS